MEELSGKTAIVTGAASGIGRAFAIRFARAGMNLVLVDIEDPPLAEVAAEVTALGVECRSVVGDVAKESTAQAMADQARNEFGSAHVVCLNAGVGSSGSLAAGELTIADWDWTLGVNLWGVIFGLQHCVPILTEQDEGHVVVTSSICGHTALRGLSPYNASKHAVAAIAETLFAELSEQGSSVGVSCLCPSLVNTKIIHSERNRPESAGTDGEREFTDEELQLRAVRDEIFSAALDPSVVADLVHDAILSKQFWIFTDHAFDSLIADRHRQIEQRANPTVSGNLIEEGVRSVS